MAQFFFDLQGRYRSFQSLLVIELGILHKKSEHILSPVPIRCHLADHEEMIITGTFDSVDENIGLDQNPI